jgi:hypothetical protein
MQMVAEEVGQETGKYGGRVTTRTLDGQKEK